jgi:S1-C subfamily serine protease
MQASKIVLMLVTVAVALGAGGCSSRFVMTEHGPQAYYQTGYPIHDTSEMLERIHRSVKRIQVTGFYTTYRFAHDARVTDAELHDPATLRRAVEQFTFDHSKAGTAAITTHVGGRVSLITSDHVTRLPERIVVHYASEDGRAATRQGARYVESVSILTRRMNTVIALRGASEFWVAQRDSINDLALIRVDVGAQPAEPIYPLTVRQGDASRLSWGSFVYVLGYPRGLKMVTTAIVSDPRQGRDHGFLLDGLFNRGISGGLILAVRGDTGALEWVGMARAASADAELLLVPEQRDIDEDRMLVPYDGRFFVERALRIDYGITFSVSMTAIRRFLQGSPADDAAQAP